MYPGNRLQGKAQDVYQLVAARVTVIDHKQADVPDHFFLHLTYKDRAEGHAVALMLNHYRLKYLFAGASLHTFGGPIL